ncbi:hypothetical protein L7F22_013278 [Adiantum nelumboides]|nr:hypothetical protein [Adiantum nelumboides]
MAVSFPTFYGHHDENARDFMDSLEMAHLMAGRDQEEVKLRAFPLVLKGEAHVWYDALAPPSKATWSGLYGAFLNKYDQGDTLENLWKQLLQHRQDSLGDYNTYESKFTNLWERWTASLQGQGGAPNFLKGDKFVESMFPTLKEKVEAKFPQTFEEAQEIATIKFKKLLYQERKSNSVKEGEEVNVPQHTNNAQPRVASISADSHQEDLIHKLTQQLETLTLNLVQGPPRGQQPRDDARPLRRSTQELRCWNCNETGHGGASFLGKEQIVYFIEDDIVMPDIATSGTLLTRKSSTFVFLSDAPMLSTSLPCDTRCISLAGDYIEIIADFRVVRKNLVWSPIHEHMLKAKSNLVSYTRSGKRVAWAADFIFFDVPFGGFHLSVGSVSGRDSLTKDHIRSGIRLSALTLANSGWLLIMALMGDTSTSAINLLELSSACKIFEDEPSQTPRRRRRPCSNVDRLYLRCRRCCRHRHVHGNLLVFFLALSHSVYLMHANCGSHKYESSCWSFLRKKCHLQQFARLDVAPPTERPISSSSTRRDEAATVKGPPAED